MEKTLKRVLIIIGILIAYAVYALGMHKAITFIVLDASNSGRKESFDNLVNNITLKEDIVIKHKETTDYIAHNNFKIRNDFKNFTKKDDNGDLTFMYYDTKDKRIVRFEINIISNTLNGSYSSDVKEKYNIATDIDYIKLLKNYEFKETRTNYLIAEENRAILSGANSYANKYGYYNVIKGDYIGLMKTDNVTMEREVFLYKNEKTYNLKFDTLGYFTDEQIIDLISTVVIE